MALMAPPPGGATLDQPPPLPPNLGAGGEGNRLQALAGQGPEGTPVGTERARMLAERAMLAEQVMSSIADMDPELVPAMEELRMRLRVAVAGRMGQSTSPPMTSGASPMPMGGGGVGLI